MLIIEDGSGVTGSNTFIALDYARAKAIELGLRISSEDSAAELQLAQAYHLLTRNYQQKLKGSPLSDQQTGIAPRTTLDAVPFQFGYAQLGYVDALERNTEVNVIDAGQTLTSMNVQGTYSETYAGGATKLDARVGAVHGWLNSFLTGVTLNRDNYFYDKR